MLLTCCDSYANIQTFAFRCFKLLLDSNIVSRNYSKDVNSLKKTCWLVLDTCLYTSIRMHHFSNISTMLVFTPIVLIFLFFAAQEVSSRASDSVTLCDDDDDDGNCYDDDDDDDHVEVQQPSPRNCDCHYNPSCAKPLKPLGLLPPLNEIRVAHLNSFAFRLEETGSRINTCV